jgi:hypothetical protein
MEAEFQRQWAFPLGVVEHDLPKAKAREEFAA